MIFKSISVLSFVLLVVCVEENDFDIMFDHDEVLISNEVMVTENHEPRLSNGIWVCGNCDNLSEDNVLYSELNQVDFGNGVEPRELQVGLSAEGMRCVTVSGSQVKGLQVLRGSGSCSGDYVTLVLRGSGDVTIKVSAYSDDELV